MGVDAMINGGDGYRRSGTRDRADRQAGGPVIFTAVVWSLSVLLAALGLYSSWALRGGKNVTE